MFGLKGRWDSRSLIKRPSLDAAKVLVAAYLIVWAPVATAAPRLYVSTEAGVTVIDPETNAIVMDIDLGPSRAIAVTPDNRKVYVAPVDSSAPFQISVLDAQTGLFISTVSVPGFTTSIAISSSGEFAYASHISHCTAPSECRGSNGLTRIQIKNDETVDTFTIEDRLGGGPIDVALTPDGRFACTLTAGGSVVTVDTETREIVATREAVLIPTSLEVDPEGLTVYALGLADLSDGGEIQVLEIPEVPTSGFVGYQDFAPWALSFSSNRDVAYVSGDEPCLESYCGTLSVLDKVELVEIDRISLGSHGGGPVAISSRLDRLYVLGSRMPSISVIDTNSDTFLTAVALAAHPYSVAISEADEDRHSSSGCALSSTNHRTGSSTLILLALLMWAAQMTRRLSWNRQRNRRRGVALMLTISVVSLAHAHVVEAIHIFDPGTVQVRGDQTNGQLEAGAWVVLQGAKSVQISDIPVLDSLAVTLDLKYFQPVDLGARFRIGSEPVRTLATPAGLRHFRGSVRGVLDSTAYLVARENLVSGFLIVDGKASQFRAQGGQAENFLESQVQNSEQENDTWGDDTAEVIGGLLTSPLSTSGGNRLRANIAVEVTQAALASFPGSGAAQQLAARDYVLDLIASTSVLYEFWADVDIKLAFLQIWPSDPSYYSNPVHTSDSQRLCRFRAFWETCFPRRRPIAPLTAGSCNFSEPAIGSCSPDQPDPNLTVPRDFAMQIARPAFQAVGRAASPSLNYRDGAGVCGIDAYGFATISQATTRFPEVFGHEIGHIFGSPHSNCYKPPLDMCKSGEFSVFPFGQCFVGTPVPAAPNTASIMSHCRDAVAVPYRFHRIEGLWMRGYAESGGCLTEAPCHGLNEPDADGDQLADFCDNCPNVFNPAQSVCPGDCNCNGAVDIVETTTAVSIAMGENLVSRCRAADGNMDGSVSIAELIQVVGRALHGCSPFGGGGSGEPSVALQIGSASGVRGAPIAIPIGMSGSNHTAGGVQLDVLFDTSVVAVQDVATACSLGSAVDPNKFKLAASLPFFPPLQQGLARLRLMVSPIGLPSTFGDGTVAACNFQITSDAPVGSHVLSGAQPIVSTSSGLPRAASLQFGSVMVCDGCGCS